MDYAEKFLKHIWVDIRKQEERAYYMGKECSRLFHFLLSIDRTGRETGQSPAAELWANCPCAGCGAAAAQARR